MKNRLTNFFNSMALLVCFSVPIFYSPDASAVCAFTPGSVPTGSVCKWRDPPPAFNIVLVPGFGPGNGGVGTHLADGDCACQAGNLCIQDKNRWGVCMSTSAPACTAQTSVCGAGGCIDDTYPDWNEAPFAGGILSPFSCKSVGACTGTMGPASAAGAKECRCPFGKYWSGSACVNNAGCGANTVATASTRVVCASGPVYCYQGTCSGSWGVAPPAIGQSCASSGQWYAAGGCKTVNIAPPDSAQMSCESYSPWVIFPSPGQLVGGPIIADQTGTLCPGPRCTGQQGIVIPGTGGQREKCVCSDPAATWNGTICTGGTPPPCPSPAPTTPVTGDPTCGSTMVAPYGYNVKCDYTCPSPLPATCTYLQTNSGSSCAMGSGAMFDFGACPGCTSSSCQLVPNGASPLPVPSNCVTPSASPSPVVPVTSFNWLEHQCGAQAGYTPSAMPSPQPAGVTNFNQLMNPMAACCWNGWAQPGNAASSKMDCIQAVPPTGEDFLKFYYAGGPRATPPVATPDPVLNAGVSNANQLFMLNAAGTAPINGFYNAKGERCSYLSGPKTGPAQMALFDSALDAGAPPADVKPNCCNLILLALERTCPTREPPGVRWQSRPPESPVIRCSAAERMKVHFALFDLCNPMDKKRARFHGATSIPGIGNTDNFPVAPLELDALIKKSFPTQSAGTCPAHFHMSGGKCVID